MSFDICDNKWNSVLHTVECFRFIMADVENGTGTPLDDTFQESFDAGDTTATSALTEDSGVEDPVRIELKIYF